MNNSNVEMMQLFQKAVDCGIIDVQKMEQQVEDAQRQKVLALHKYAIYTTSDGYWHTYITDENKPYKRKAIKRKTKKGLEDFLVKLYTTEKEEKLETIQEIYPHWLQYMNQVAETSATPRRYDCDWHTWLKNDPITRVPLMLLDHLTMNAWAHQFVKGENPKGIQLKARQYYNIVAIMKGCLEYAVQKQIIARNPYDKVKVKKKFFKSEMVSLDDSKQVFTERQIQQVREIAWNEYLAKQDEAALAVLFISYTGLRAGEACGLKWKCVSEDFSEIFIMAQNRKKEHLNSDGTWAKATWQIEEKTKTDAGVRTVYLPSALIAYINYHKNSVTHKEKEDCVFLSKKGTPLTPTQLYKRTARYSKMTSGIKRSTHKIRKTYLTTLHNGGVHENTILKLAGHEINGQSVGQVLHENYLRDQSTPDEIRYQLDKIFEA